MAQGKNIERHFDEHYFVSGHTACSGCGQAIAARLVANVAGPKTIIANSTGCLEVFSTKSPESSWRVPWVHSLFENSAAVASGIEAALKHEGKEDINVIAQAGDGGTGDIGLQAISGMLERNHNILFVCYDNEAYMNTGIQRSGLTQFEANTTTSPIGKVTKGKLHYKKPVLEIFAAHCIPYAASTSIAYPRDLERKVKKALETKGPKYLQIHVPCPLGWGHLPSLTMEIAKNAVLSGLYPMVEYENGEVVKVFKISKRISVDEYVRPQARFKHLIKDVGAMKALQEVADKNIEYYKLG